MPADALVRRDMHRDTPHDARRAADRVPTLTEVVELDSLFPATQVPFDEPSLGLRDPALVHGTTGPESRAASDFDTRAGASALSAEVLFELEQRIGAALEARLRQALAPALARAADSLIQEARQELAQTLRDLVDESVTRALESRTHL